MSVAVNHDPIDLCEASDRVVTARACCHVLEEDLAALTEVLEQCGDDRPGHRRAKREVQGKKADLDRAYEELTRALRDERAAADALA